MTEERQLTIADVEGRCPKAGSQIFDKWVDGEKKAGEVVDRLKSAPMRNLLNEAAD